LFHDHKKEICLYLDDVWEEAKNERARVFGLLRAAKYTCLFGAGEIGRAVAYELADAGLKADSFCDNNSELWGKTITQNISCISPHQLVIDKDDTRVLITTGYFRQVRAQLESLGITDLLMVPKLMIRNSQYLDRVSCASVQENLCRLIDILNDEESKRVLSVIVRNWFGRSDSLHTYGDVATFDQYFPPEIISLSEHEVFIDAGAFNGDTLTNFLSHVRNRFLHAIAYELDKTCYRQLQGVIQGMNAAVKERITAYNLGLYDTNGHVSYIDNATSSSINSSAGRQGRVVRLDDHLAGATVTFIKMDIEGAEINALRGAERTLTSSVPKLAISVYHQPAHIWEVPLLLKKLVPDYRIYLRHHSTQEFETVCYAVL